MTLNLFDRCHTGKTMISEHDDHKQCTSTARCQADQQVCTFIVSWGRNGEYGRTYYGSLEHLLDTNWRKFNCSLTNGH